MRIYNINEFKEIDFKEKITRKDIVDTIYNIFKSRYFRLGKKYILRILFYFINLIIEAVYLNKVIEIRGFGTFSIRKIKPHKQKYRLNKSKECFHMYAHTINIPEIKYLHFKQSKSIKKLLNKNREITIYILPKEKENDFK